MDHEAVELILANRAFLYGVLARGYAEEMNESFAEILTSDHAAEEVTLVETAGASSPEGPFDEVLAWLLSSNKTGKESGGGEPNSKAPVIGDADESGAQETGHARKTFSKRTVELIAQEYVRIFIGPGTLKADPWESVHLTGRRVLFQPHVLEIRDAYHAAGFLPARYRKVSDDFIGIECDFMAKLAERALKSHRKGDDVARDEDLRTSQDFLTRHLSIWIDSLASRIEEGYGECFYAAFTRFAASVFRRDITVLDQLL